MVNSGTQESNEPTILLNIARPTMPEYTAIIRFENLEAYQRHDKALEKLVNATFADKGATVHTPWMSTRSLPPTHNIRISAGEDVSLEELRQVRVSEGVILSLHGGS